MDVLQEQAKRYCDSMPNCSACPLGESGTDGCLVYVMTKLHQSAEYAISEVVRWNKENPPEEYETYANVFFRIFKSAQRIQDSVPIPSACLRSLVPRVNCIGDCVKCWSRKSDLTEKEVAVPNDETKARNIS